MVSVCQMGQRVVLRVELRSAGPRYHFIPVGHRHSPWDMYRVETIPTPLSGLSLLRLMARSSLVVPSPRYEVLLWVVLLVSRLDELLILPSPIPTPTISSTQLQSKQMEKSLSEELLPSSVLLLVTISRDSMQMEHWMLPSIPISLSHEETKSEPLLSSQMEKSSSEESLRPSEESHAIVSRDSVQTEHSISPSIRIPTTMSMPSHSKQMAKSSSDEPSLLSQEQREIEPRDSSPQEL